MSFFVWRKDHEDLKRQLAEREAELRHILNLMWKQGFGVTLFSEIGANNVTNSATVSDTKPATDSEPELTEEEQLELERQRDIAELTVLKRTSPSRLGGAMTRILARNQQRAVRAAHPDPSNKVSKAFEQARKEVS